MNNFACIDIGSNTINLLIGRKGEDGRLEKLHFERIPAKLGKGGMQQGLLTDEAILRGLKALKRHSVSCEIAQVAKLRVTATSAVRTANNSQDFVRQVKEELDLDIEVISGDREAQLIFRGVRLSGLLDDDAALIMDIGGGSTEFIVADKKSYHWKKSYKLGVTRLMERFRATDPFCESEEEQMKQEIHSELDELWQVSKKFGIKRMIGASGSFSSMNLMIKNGNLEQVHPIADQIPLDEYHQLSKGLRRQATEARSAIAGLVPDRIETIPYSALMIDLVLEGCAIDSMYRTSYALKEGVLSEMLAL